MQCCLNQLKTCSTNFLNQIRTQDTFWSRVLIWMKSDRSDSDGLYRITVTVQSIQKISSTSQSKANVSQTFAVRISQPSFHASSSCSENSSVDFCLWNSSANSVHTERITGSVSTHNSSPANYRSLSWTRIRFNLYMHRELVFIVF